MKDPKLKVMLKSAKLAQGHRLLILSFESAQAGVIKDLVLLACVGVRPVLVHGGGPEINIWLNKLGIEAEFKNGLRVTDGMLAPALSAFADACAWHGLVNAETSFTPFANTA